MPISKIAPLLFASGFCALVYQVVWLRLLRQIFGASTEASAAALAIFMAGLGIGSLTLGPRADRQRKPLGFYARLEAGIALLAALSPLLVGLAQKVYLTLGDATAIGSLVATPLRLALSVLVLGLPTWLMGGTLPAAARAVERATDGGRRGVAKLYGANTLGAVCGVLFATFIALETFGLRGALWAASLLNLLVAAIAWRLADASVIPVARSSTSEAARGDTPSETRFVLIAAAATGFVFFLMEMVWYRMLAPVLGGSSYTFGTILAVALLGVGIGGLLYGQRTSNGRPTLFTFAGTCSLQALFLLAPFALGDRIAVVAMLLRPMGDISFGLLIAVWTALTAVVVLPTAVVAGYQFPLLIALLGDGRDQVGRQVGLAYAWNTAGGVAGAVAGGFGLITLVSAPVLWRGCAVLLLALAGAAAWHGRNTDGLHRRLAAVVIAAAASLALLASPGPSAVWRHTPIGAGGMPSSFEGPGDVRRMSQAVRRAIIWQRDGRESSVAVHGLDDISVLVNGKADGSALHDAPTQVMSGLIGAVLHPSPRRALVVGLGTGTSAGWLAEVPGIERVDVVELEPAMAQVAQLCAPVNHDAMSHPRVHLEIGDGREFLRTTRQRYDLIFSEPSNPYRAGIASLFTRELYHAAADRLGENGLFLQWLQSYHIDSAAVRTVIATLKSIFPYVESWQVHSGDLMLVASRQPIVHDLERIRPRTQREPVRSALRDVFGVEGAEGFYSAFVANSDLAQAILAAADQLNTDDRPIVEFGFARGLGRDLGFSIRRLAALAVARGEHLPPITGGRLDWRRVNEMRRVRDSKWGSTQPPPPQGDENLGHRIAARNAYVLGDLKATLRRWQRQLAEPASPLDRLMIAEALAETADPAAPLHAGRLLQDGQPVAAAAVLARFEFRTGRFEQAAEHLIAAAVAARQHPWCHRATLERALLLAAQLARIEPILGLDLFDALGQPFAVRLLDEARLRTRLDIAEATAFAALCEAALSPFEPHVPWEETFLSTRHRCYETLTHPLEPQARADLETFHREAPRTLHPRPM